MGCVRTKEVASITSKLTCCCFS